MKTQIKSKHIKPARFPGMGIRDKELFIENMSILLASGMDISSAFKAIEDGAPNKRVARAINFLRIKITEGSSLSEIFQELKFFPKHTISLIRLGESTGHLPENLKIVAEGQQKEKEFRSKIRSAMIYPIIVLTLTLLVGIGVAWYVLPKLSIAFEQLNVKMPTITLWIIAFGNFLSKYGLIAVPIFFLFVFINIFFLFFYPPTKSLGQSLLFRLPGTRELYLEIELGRFGYILGSLLSAGLPVIESLKSMQEAAILKDYKRLYLYLAESIEEGNSFRESFKKFKFIKKLIPSSVQQIIVAAENSGKLPESLLKIGKIYEDKTDTTSKNLSIILEPILLVIVWLGVLLVALSVILPIYSLIGGLSK